MMEILYMVIGLIILGVICQQTERELDRAILDQEAAIEDWNYYNDINY